MDATHSFLFPTFCPNSLLPPPPFWGTGCRLCTHHVGARCSEAGWGGLRLAFGPRWEQASRPLKGTGHGEARLAPEASPNSAVQCTSTEVAWPLNPRLRTAGPCHATQASLHAGSHHLLFPTSWGHCRISLSMGKADPHPKAPCPGPSPLQCTPPRHRSVPLGLPASWPATLPKLPRLSGSLLRPPGAWLPAGPTPPWLPAGPTPLDSPRLPACQDAARHPGAGSAVLGQKVGCGEQLQ